MPKHGLCKRPFESLFNSLKYHADKTGRGCSLTYEQFLFLSYTSHACHYCGVPLAWQPFNERRNGSNYRGNYFLDRKDTTLGYSEANCVACCTQCNYAKSNRYSYEEWVVMTAALRRFRDEQESKQKCS